jgi:hypothetical protein
MDMTGILKILRRRIGDTDTPYTFTDDLLTGYIEDAVAQVEMDWERGFMVDSASSVFNIEPTMQDATLFCIKAHYLIKLRTKDKADRDNFRMVKGRLTLDNTNQSSDHKDTLEFIEKEYRRTIYRMKNSGSLTGVRME